jgi:uncharacterized membrane protein YraQ (UPF0718 family)
LNAPWWQQFFDVILLETGKMWWIFLLSVLLVGLIKGYKLDLKIRDSIVRAGSFAIPLAVVIGMISPLCACGILPIFISLAMVGTPLAPLMALLVTSPVMGPDALLLTWSGLGPDWAIYKIVGAAVLGLGSGFSILFLERRGWLNSDMILLEPLYREDGSLAPAADIGAVAGVHVKRMQIVPRSNKFRFIFDRSLDAALFIGPYLLLAIVLEAFMVTLIPVAWIKFLVGAKSFWSLLMAALIGLPLPTNQIPIIPILSGLLSMGIDKGAAYTLLLAGPVTSLPAMVALGAMFSRRLLLVFVSLGLGLSVLMGLLLQIVS